MTSTCSGPSNVSNASSAAPSVAGTTTSRGASRQHGVRIRTRRRHEPELAGREVGRGNADRNAIAADASRRRRAATHRRILRRTRTQHHCAEEVVAGAVEQVVAERRARRDRLDHLALDDAFRELGILDLLADRHAESLRDESPQVLIRRFHRNARQRHLGCPAVVPRCQRETEYARRHLGVVEEHLVEIAHPEEQDRVGMPRLDLPVLRHQRRLAATLHGRRTCARNASPRSFSLYASIAAAAAPRVA
ncbi:MAG TPA: hypothetical protein PK788_06140 [Gemmatimonadaceae bacterium]|nr:hypothetical protein [Gemmatimonadaceae bacterium]